MLQRKFHVGQFIREEGPATHTGKASTPTMGGVCFWLIICLVSTISLAVRDSLSIDAIAVLTVSSLCAILGLVDDLAKFASKSNAGISAWLRLLIQFAIGTLLGIVLLSIYGPDLAFGQLVGNMQGHFQAYYLVLPVACYLAGIAFVFAATCNALNLHDGLDGLATGTSLQVFLCLAVMLQYLRQPSFALIAAVTAGSMLAFLIYNRHPAKIFMGDVGSLFLGALMVSLAIVSHLVLWFVPLALIYIVETLSVITQVSVFKLTKPYTAEKSSNPISLFIFKLTHRLPGEGKRVFRITPLHHHFEVLFSEGHLGEGAVVSCFWLVQFVICIAVMGIFYWQFNNTL
jgi:phospho-N-acetylmuramoyl-pentapeptide-transferase